MQSFETELQPVSSFIQFRSYMSIDYIFEEKQTILVELYQCSKGNKMDSSLLGSTEILVGRTIHSGGEEEVPLRIPQGATGESEPFNGSMILCIREEPSIKQNIVLKMQGVGLDKKDMFGKSDPYIIILRRNERGKDTVDPDIDDVIGEFITTARFLLTCTNEGRNFELINRSKFRRKKVYSNSGVVNVKVSISSNACSFLDYILSGTSINVIVGIDLSNQIHQSNSPMRFTEAISIARSAAVNNEYIIAIQAVVEILQVYDR
ncbi:unnamed protein product [Rodentolepis nana]|uniref:C2 domain-containing protein n=1 Tax=Rodentolepis nana TaxID=102285 RepID=A0A0R3T1S2_RODNA|nr:unnamed protein product [Rodentolepis nana]